MTTIQITLPDELAQEAKQAGMLTPELLEKWLRDQLKAQRRGQLFSAMDRMSSEDAPAAMPPEQVAEELAAMRAGRRAPCDAHRAGHQLAVSGLLWDGPPRQLLRASLARDHLLFESDIGYSVCPGSLEERRE